MTRVAITGIGIVSPFGRGRDATIEALRSGRSGIGRLESIDTTELICRIGGEVPAAAHEGTFKGYDRFTRFALIAAEEAVEQAGFVGAGYESQPGGGLIGTRPGGCA